EQGPPAVRFARPRTIGRASRPGRSMASEAHGLAVRDVGVAFHGLVALDGVSVDVQPHEIVGIIGPNGAGKTTLFNTICGFVRPDRGEVFYRGSTLARTKPHQLT